MAPQQPPPQHTCVGLLIVEARRQASAGESWRRVSTCYGRTAASAVASSSSASPLSPLAAAAAAQSPEAEAAKPLDLAAHHLARGENARPGDMHMMTACLGRSIYEVTPVFAEEEEEEEEREAAAAAGGGGGAGEQRRSRRRTYAPPPACAGIELLQVLRAPAAAEGAASPAPASRPWPAAAASASAASPSSSSADRLAAFGRRFATRAEKNAAAMYKLLSDIGTGVARGPPREG
jgi:hypothetical protein